MKTENLKIHVILVSFGVLTKQKKKKNRFEVVRRLTPATVGRLLSSQWPICCSILVIMSVSRYLCWQKQIYANTEYL